MDFQTFLETGFSSAERRVSGITYDRRGFGALAVGYDTFAADLNT